MFAFFFVYFSALDEPRIRVCSFVNSLIHEEYYNNLSHCPCCGLAHFITNLKFFPILLRFLENIFKAKNRIINNFGFEGCPPPRPP